MKNSKRRPEKHRWNKNKAKNIIIRYKIVRKRLKIKLVDNKKIEEKVMKLQANLKNL